MKKLLLIFYFLCCVFCFCFSQCPFNLDFETGTTTGWVCKSGAYGVGPCPVQQPGTCPTFITVDTTIGCINANGINAPLNTGIDRHTIVSASCYGTGIDPNSLAPHLINVVGNGNFSFRLGDGKSGGIGTVCPGLPPDCYARSEAIRLTFNVMSQNALFSYRYAVFIQDPGHWPEEQPCFETFITKPDSGDKLIPTGYNKVIVSSFNPSCPATTGFYSGVGTWKYTDWIDVGLDLSSYIGENIAVEFRTHDCFPQSASYDPVCNNNCCTTCLNGICCKDSLKCSGGPPWCYTAPACNNQVGSHSAYVYLDASCLPVTISELNKTQNLFSINLSPNPFHTTATLEIKNKEFSNAELKIYDRMGRLVSKQIITQKSTIINREGLSDGLYFYELRTNNYELIGSGKFVVE